MNLSLILKIADEYEDKLKKIYLNELKKRYPTGNEFHDLDLANEKLLLMLGLTPIFNSESYNDEEIKDKIPDNSLLGRGGYAAAYRVLYKGRPAVAKVTESKEDIDATLQLDGLRSQLGPLAKHLLKIYDYFELDGKYILIVEELNKLNPYVRQALFAAVGKRSKPRHAYVTSKFKDKYFVSSLVKNTLNKLPNSAQLLPEDLKKISNAINLLFLKENWSKISRHDLQSFTTSMFIMLKALMAEEIQENSKILTYINEVCGYFLEGLRSLWYDFEKNLPEDFTENTALAESLPESKSLMKLLLKLHKDFGIAWGDLHSSNLMERPGTREIVISDPGLFSNINI